MNLFVTDESFQFCPVGTNDEDNCTSQNNRCYRHKTSKKDKTDLVPLATHVILGPTVGPAYGPTRQNQWAWSYADMAVHVSMTPPLRSHYHVEMWSRFSD
jgi:hypothetical protein